MRARGSARKPLLRALHPRGSAWIRQIEAMFENDEATVLHTREGIRSSDYMYTSIILQSGEKQCTSQK